METIDGAEVYVGSCPYSSLHRNNRCNDVGDVNYVTEVYCPSRTYGRYVYITQNGNTVIALCEIEIYGTEGKWK